MRYRLRILMIATAFCLVVAGISVGIHYATRPIAFSPSTWRAHPGQRPRMITDVLAKRPFQGKSRAEVEALLGEYDPGSDDERLIYRAGSDGVIDDMWLEIRFKGGKAYDVRYYPD